MEESPIHILGIAPYEGMKAAMERAAESYPNIKLDTAIGDLDEGTAIVKGIPVDAYDCIISRGGTAEQIRKISTIPVIDIQLSVYDVLRSIKLAENYGGRYAIVGFPSITEPAHILCDLLRYNLDIITIHGRDDVVETLNQLHQEGYRMVVGDMVTHTAARNMGMDAFLITSGAEGLRTALEQAISFSSAFRRIRQENRLLRSMNPEGVSVALLDRKGGLRYSYPGEPAADLLNILRSHLKEVVPGRPLSFYYKSLNTLYGITARQISMWENSYVLFTCRPGQIPLRGSKLGMRSYGKVECEHLFMSSFYSLSGAMGEIETTVSAYALSRQSVLIVGEDGTGKEQIARALYLRSGWTNTPFWVFNCQLLAEKSWDFLLNHANSPFNDDRNTLYFQYFETLSENRLNQLYTLIQETGLAKRQRLIFSCTCREGEALAPAVRKCILGLGCLTLRMPALRIRSDEIPSLASLYLNSLNQELGKQISGFEPKAIEQLRRYPWPHNYTQFKQVLYELAILCDSSYIGSTLVAETLSKESSLTHAAQRSAAEKPPEGTLEEITRKIIYQTLEDCGGNQTAAAKRLGISRTTLWRHLGEGKN